MMHQQIAAEAHHVTIMAIYRDECVERLTKLQKRAARYGQTIAWTETPRTEQRTAVRWDGKRVTFDVQLVDLVLEGSAPRCGDFQFIAQLERTAGGVIISGKPGVEVGAQGREWDGGCDHCGSRRNRTNGYVVEDSAGLRKVVGRSCLRDHLGMDAPEGLAAMFSRLRELADIGDEDEWGGLGGGWYTRTTVAIVAAARVSITLWGWRPAKFDGQTTSSFVQLLFRTKAFDKHEQHLRQQRDELLAELAAHADRYEAEAQAIVEWARTMNPRSDYEHNLRVAMTPDIAISKHWGLICSASAAYDRQVAVQEERAAKAAATKPSHHIGTVGKRMSVPVTMERVISLPDRGWGPSWIHVLRTESGAIVKWKTSSGVARVDGKRVVDGQQLQATFTPKAHGEYSGQPETTVLRLALAALPTKS